MTAPQRYRKKPVAVEAMQWDGTASGATPIIDWILACGGTASYMCSDPNRCAENDRDTPHSIAIETLEGTMCGGLHDWIIKGVKGEFYPCKPDIFEATYESADAPVSPVTVNCDHAELARIVYLAMTSVVDWGDRTDEAVANRQANQIVADLLSGKSSKQLASEATNGQEGGD